MRIRHGTRPARSTQLVDVVGKVADEGVDRRLGGLEIVDGLHLGLGLAAQIDGLDEGDALLHDVVHAQTGGDVAHRLVVDDEHLPARLGPHALERPQKLCPR